MNTTEHSVPPDPMETTILRSDSIKSSSLLQLSNNVSQYILLHPFVALRRTCQRKQGLPALYKGLSSELLVKGVTFGAESAIINYTDWPREVGQKRFAKDLFRVLTLRGLSVALSTPFLCAALKETIQSVIIVRDRPSFVDCLKDGFLRLIHLRSIPSARMLPIWLLIVPTVFYHVAHSAIWHATTKSLELLRNSLTSSCCLSKYRGRKTVRHQTKIGRSLTDESGWQQANELTYEATETSIDANNIDTDSQQISNSIMANLIADVALLPIETVLNCLYIQGTRTIIDNVDETTVVLPVLTNYDGFSDCYQSILKFEGPLGLYKGLGAVILQYSMHLLIFKVMYHLLKEFQNNDRVMSPPRPRRPLRPVSDYKRHLEHNRHSTPSNPNEPGPRLDSFGLLQDTSIGGERDSLNYGLLGNRIDMLPRIYDD